MFSINIPVIKALSDETRLRIVSMLSCGELCGCKILEKFNITQPTLSHHMKILCDCGLVIWRRDGNWKFYSLNQKMVYEFITFFQNITSPTENCNEKESGCCD